MKEGSLNSSGDISWWVRHTIRRFIILYLLTSWMAKATSAFKQNLLYRWLVTHNPGQVTVYISLTRLKFCFFSE